MEVKFSNFKVASDPAGTGGFGAVEVFADTVINHSEVIDPASIAAGEELDTDLTVTGAALGDYAMVSIGVDVTGLIVSAQVTAADTVTVTLANATVGAIDLASSTWKAKVIHDAL